MIFSGLPVGWTSRAGPPLGIFAGCIDCTVLAEVACAYAVPFLAALRVPGFQVHESAFWAFHALYLGI